MDMSGQLHTPAALPPGKEARYEVATRLGGAQGRSGQGGEGGAQSQSGQSGEE